MAESARRYKSTDLTANDEMRVQRIIDFVQANTGSEIKTPDAIRAAFTAWEEKYLPKPVAAGPSMASDPEGNKEFLDRAGEQQLNPED
jgi:hypothetical protein